MDWFLYGKDFSYERVNELTKQDQVTLIIFNTLILREAERIKASVCNKA